MSQAVEQSTKYLEWLEYLVSLHLKEEYDELRHEAQELKASAEVDGATRALGVFFFEHTSAFLRWISSYDYEAIRKREENVCAALREKYQQDFPEADREAVVAGLAALSLLVIEGTHIENGMIASDPNPMFEHSQRMELGLDAALDQLSRWKEAHDPLTKDAVWLRAVNMFIKELEWRRAVNNGTKEYARLLVHFPYNRDYFLANVDDVERHLDEILAKYTKEHFETCSDLRAHKEFLRHQRQYLQPDEKTLTESTPYFRDTHISWLLNFQIDRMLASWLCSQLAPSEQEQPEEEEEEEEEEDPSAEVNAAEDGPQTRDAVEEAAEAEDEAEDAAAQLALTNERERFRRIWHRSTASKHGKMDRRWKRPHIEYIEAEDSEDFVETGFGEHEMHACIIKFRPVQTHLVSLADVTQGSEEREPDELAMTLKIYAYGICTVEFSIDEQDLDVFQLRQLSALIAPFAHKSAFTWVEGHHHSEAAHAAHHDESQLEPLAENVFKGLKAAVKSYIHSHIIETKKMIREKRRGPSLATRVVAAAHESLSKLEELRDHAKDNNNWMYLPHLNWYTYANPREMTRALLVDSASGEKTFLSSPLGSFQISELPEFKGLVLPLREKRASLHDWLAMRAPEKRNLAEITSHVDDLFYVSNHSALLYFPDDPNFNVLQFIELVSTATRLYCLVTSMVARAKVEFDQLAELEEEVEQDISDPSRLSVYSRELLLNKLRARHAASQHFDSDARRSLDLLTLRIVSKYLDTTKLMVAMTNELEITGLRQLFDETMERVNQKRSRLLETVGRLQSAQIEEQASRLQTATAVIATLLAAAGLDAIITDFQSAFSSRFFSLSYLHLLLILIVILVLAFFLLRYVGRSRAIQRAIQRADRQRPS